MTDVHGYVGRALLIKRGDEKLAALVSKSISINNEAIDVTTDDDSGFRTLLEASGTRSIDISAEGVFRSDRLVRDVASASSLVEMIDIVFPTGLIIRGEFRINGLDMNAEMADKIKFSGTLQSTGAWTVDPD